MCWAAAAAVQTVPATHTVTLLQHFHTLQLHKTFSATYLFSSHHADRFASEQVADKLRNEGAVGRASRAEDQPGEAPPRGRASSVASALSLCERDAELGEVFARGGQIVPDDGHVLLDVHDDRRHVGTLVAHVLHALPRHLGRREEGQRGADGTSASRAKHRVAVEKEKNNLPIIS